MLIWATSAAASLTPPPSGDWVIDVGEPAVLGVGTTVVQGNITVNGSLYLGNGTLRLDEPAVGVIPRILIGATGQLVLENAVVMAGPNTTNRLTIDALAGARWAANSSILRQLASTTVGNLSAVGAHLVGASVDLTSVQVLSSDGGLGLDGGLLRASSLVLQVSTRGLLLSAGASARVTGFTFVGSPGGTDYLVLADYSSLDLTNGTVGNAATGILLLATRANITDVTLGPVTDVGALLVGSELDWVGGRVAPFARVGIEAYASTLRITTLFEHYQYGLVVSGSELDIDQSRFTVASFSPIGSFTGVYSYDSSVAIRSTVFNGSYILFGLPQNATSAIWVVLSNLSASDVSTSYYAEHIHSEKSAARLLNVSLEVGTTGLNALEGSLDVANLSLSRITTTGSNAIGVEAYRVTGVLRGITSRNTDIAVEFVETTILAEGISSFSPGLGARVISGSPTVSNSTFRFHNESGVHIVGGTPTFARNTFLASADLRFAYGVLVDGGRPRIVGNAFHGTFLLTYGIWVSTTAGAEIEENTFDTLHRGVVLYSTDFVVANNTFTNLWRGVESREYSSGLITANRFVNMTAEGDGIGVFVYVASTRVVANTFVNVNYGVNVFDYRPFLPAGTRVANNVFTDIGWYAIEVWNSTRPFLIDNNTIRNATRGGIELVFSTAVLGYNVLLDSEGAGVVADYSSVSVIGSRFEALGRALDARRSSVLIEYSTFARNSLGVYVQDGPATVRNSSFQFNGIAVEFVNNEANLVDNSSFVGNVEAILVFRNATVDVLDSNFIGTLDFAVSNGENSTANVTFTRRGEISGGRLYLRGELRSTAETLTLKSLRFEFAPVPWGTPGIRIEGASNLTMASVGLANSSLPYIFELSNSSGNLTQVNFRLAAAEANPNGSGPRLVDSTLTLRDVVFNDSAEGPSFERSTVEASNVTVRDNNGTGILLASSTLTGTKIAVLDNAGCGIVDYGSSQINASNLTVRGNKAGSLCFNSTRAAVWTGDFASGLVDLQLRGNSDLTVISSRISRNWSVEDTSRLTVAWVVSLVVHYPNPSLLPTANATLRDAIGLSYLYHPETSGDVLGMPPFPQFVVTPGPTVQVRTPYAVGATLGESSASAVIDLNADVRLTLELADLTSPEVEILGPADLAGFASPNVTFRFRAADSGSGIAELLYRFGAGLWSAAEASSTEFEFTRELVDGTHQFSVQATDYAGNTAEASIDVLVDTRPPLITLISPREVDHVTRAENVTVQVAVEPDVILVRIAGVEVPVVSNGASRVLVLPEGRTAILVEASDAVGNQATMTMNVTADRSPPPLEILSPEPGETTVESFAVIRGRTEAGSTILIGGNVVPAGNGTFEALVTLTEGNNRFEVRARDTLGNENLTTVEIVRGVLQPSRLLDTLTTLGGLALIFGGAALGAAMFLRPKPAEGLEAVRHENHRPNQGGKVE